jgi:predicted nucleic acid-binding protein
MRVVDASVAVKWFLTEADSEKASRLLDGGRRLVAPSIIRTEVAGAISRKFREGLLPEKLASAACDDWKEMLLGRHVELIPVADVFNRAIALSFQWRHALPDCLYLAVAEQFNAELLTADRTLHERAAKAKARVSLIGSIKLNG